MVEESGGAKAAGEAEGSGEAEEQSPVVEPSDDAARASRTRRRAVETRLSALVREHRFTIAVVFPLVGVALFAASREGVLPAWLAFNPALVLAGTLVMRLPLVAALAPLVDRRAGVALLAVAAYSYAVEFVGVHYGVPYGEFGYGVALGPMVAGVPVGLPVFFVPLVLNSYLLVLLLWPEVGRLAGVGAALGVVLVVDLVLDPAAVALGLWTYDAGGVYYGVPPSNYAGWVLSGLVAVSLVAAGFDRAALAERLETCEFALDDLVSFVLLWGALNAYVGNWLPVALAVGLAAALARADRFDVVGVGRDGIDRDGAGRDGPGRR